MKVLIVYDSYFGNTEKIAQGIHEAYQRQGSNRSALSHVTKVTPDHLKGIDLLIVGSPTRAFKPTKAIVTFLKALPDMKGTSIAAFDTRISAEEKNSRILNVMVRFFGYAAEPIEGYLRKKSGRSALPAEGFIVHDSEGPLKDGELERAQKWALSLK